MPRLSRIRPERRDDWSDRAASDGDGSASVLDQADSDFRQAGLTRTATSAISARIALERDTEAMARDEVARLRDETAAARDLAADLADREAAELAGSLGEVDERTAAALAAVAKARVRAAAARERAAADRRHAARDRAAAARDREQLQAEVRRAQVDELTGAFRRGLGEVADLPRDRAGEAQQR